MRRFRLRFQHQEIDLRVGDTMIGRSGSCQVTIEDPLVSRHHARVRIAGGRPTIEDLKSRNGTYVNGVITDGARVLEDQDRIRIGTLELVFCVQTDVAQEAGPSRRITGALCRCSECGAPYADDLDECPICGARRVREEVTISGVGSSPEGWSLELAAAVLDRALSLQRWEDVERMLRRARGALEGLVAVGERLERSQLEHIGQAGARLALHHDLPDWAVWVLTIYATLALVPDAVTLRDVVEVDRRHPGQLTAAAARLVRKVQASGGPRPDEIDALATVRAMAGV